MEGMNYSELIQNILESHAINHADDDTEIQIIFDAKRDRYLMINIGWENLRRVYSCIIHVEIKDNKIWIQRDGTEVGIANELVAGGISKQNIVLGFKAPYKRKLTGFAVE